VSRWVMVDTSAWIHALRRVGDGHIRARIEQLLSEQAAAWCEMLRLELWSGVGGEAERRALEQLDPILPRMPINDAVWSSAAELAGRARTNGISAPAADLLIFACAKTYGLEIEHVDRHYEMLAKLA
jgi:predicted nucleic acid-binding protein